MTLYFSDSFDQGMTGTWELVPGWRAELEGENYVLSGRGQSWARLKTGEDWTDYLVRFRLKLIHGVIQLNYRVSDKGRYFVGFGAEGLYLKKEARQGEFIDLAASDFPHELGTWHDIQIAGEGGKLLIFVNDRLELAFTDPDPLRAGTIAFETLEDSSAQVDDVTVSSEPVRVIDLDSSELLSLRMAGLPFIAGERAQELFRAAEESLHKAMLQADRGDLSEARRILREAEGAYRESILVGLREGILKQAERWLEEERMNMTSEKLETAKELFRQARAEEISLAKFRELIDKIKAVLLAGTLLPDLTVELYNVPYSNIKGIRPSPPLTDRATILSVLVKNVGLAPVDSAFDIDLYVDGVLEKTWKFSPILGEEDPLHSKSPLDPGESRIYEHEVRFPLGGQHTFKWVVDAKNEIAESDKTNNELTVTAVWQYPPDLIVKDIWPDGASVGGQKSTWKIEIKNIGKGDVNIPFQTTFLPEVPGGTQENFWTQSLPAGKSIVFTSTQNFRAWGERTLRAEVDVGNFVPEALPDGENNNELVKQFDLKSVGLAVKNLSLNPAQPLPYEPVTFSFVVKNSGPGDAIHPFKVRVYPGILVKDLLQPVLLPAKSLKVGDAITLQHTVKLPPGDHLIVIEADYPDPDIIYFEPDRENYVLVKQIHVPDPVVKIAKVEPYKSCKNDYHVTLDRSGSYWNGDVLLRLVHQGKVLDEDTILAAHSTGIIGVGHLDPGTTAEGKYNWAATVNLVAYAKEGNRLFKSKEPDIQLDVEQYARLYLRDMSPTSGKIGTKVNVTFTGATLLRPDKSVNVEVFPGGGGGIDPKVKPKIISTKTINSYTDRIVVELDIANDAPLGKRLISISQCAHWLWSAPFYVVTEETPALPPKLPKPPEPVKKPDLLAYTGWTEPSMTDLGGLPAGKPFIFYFTGANVGTKEAPASKALVILNSGQSSQQSTTISISQLKVGEFFKALWKFPSGLPKGNHTFDVYMDYDNKVDELSKGNNHVYVGIIVGY